MNLGREETEAKSRSFQTDRVEKPLLDGKKRREKRVRSRKKCQGDETARG